MAADDIGVNVNLNGDASGFLNAIQQASSGLFTFSKGFAANYTMMQHHAAKFTESIVNLTDDFLHHHDRLQVATTRFILTETAAYNEIAQRSQTFRDSLKQEVQQIADVNKVAAARRSLGEISYYNDLIVKSNEYRNSLKEEVQVASVNKYAQNLGLVAASTASWATTQKAYFDSITAGWTTSANQVQQFASAWNTAATNVQQKAIAAQQAMFDSWTSGWTNPQPSLAAQFTNVWNTALGNVQQKAQQAAVDIANSFQQGFANAQANAQKVAQFTQSMQMAAARAMSAGGPMFGPAMPTIAAKKQAAEEEIKDNNRVGQSLMDLVTKYAKVAAASTALYKGWQFAAQLVSKAISGYNQLGEAIMGLKLVTGDTTEQTSEFLYVGNMMGITSMSLQMRIAQMAKHLVDNHKWVKALNIEYKNLDGSVKPTTKTFYEIADALQNLTDKEKRETASNAIFGRGYKDILPILALTKKQREELAKQGREGGSVWDDKQLKAQREFMMSQRALNASLVALGSTIARAVTPYLMGFFNMVRSLINQIRTFISTSPKAAAAMKVIGLGLLTIMSPMTGIIVGIAYMVQRFDGLGDAIVTVSELFGNVLGKAFAVTVKAFKWLMDAVITFAGAFLKIGEVVTGNRFWKAIFGDGAHEAITSALDAAHEFQNGMDKILDNVGQNAWDHGGEWGKKWGQGAIDLMKKMKIKPSDISLGFGEGAGFDPSAGGGGGGGKNKLVEHFKQMVDTARQSLNALVEEAKNAKKQMDDTTNAVRDSLRSAFSITALAEETGGGVSGAGMIALFQRRLEAMRGFVANVRKLRDMGIPADWLSEIVNAGVDKGAALARMLVSQPGVLSQLTELRSQMNVETQAAGEMVGQAMFGDKVADAISRSTTYQQQFQRLLLAGKRVGYKPTAEDIQLATQSIANTVYMNVGTNADPFAIENAIAWALKTGVGGGGGRGGGGIGGGGRSGSSGASQSTYAPYWNGRQMVANQNVQMPVSSGLTGPNLHEPGLQGPTS